MNQYIITEEQVERLGRIMTKGEYLPEVVIAEMQRFRSHPYQNERDKVLTPLKVIYEKFDHLDKCLSDTEWCEEGNTSAIYGIAGEMWRAIKEALRQAGEP